MSSLAQQRTDDNKTNAGRTERKVYNFPSPPPELVSGPALFDFGTLARKRDNPVPPLYFAAYFEGQRWKADGLTLVNSKLAKVPDYVVSCLACWYARHQTAFDAGETDLQHFVDSGGVLPDDIDKVVAAFSGQARTVKVGAVVTCLMQRGLEILCGDHENQTPTGRYRELRRAAMGEDFAPEAQAYLYRWMKRCTWEPPAGFASTDSYAFKTSDAFHGRLVGRAQELGLPNYALGVAALAVGLSTLEEIREDTRAALRAIGDRLQAEMEQRADELERRMERCRDAQ